MISREQLINDPGKWISTENLKLDCFDALEKISGLFYLKIKDSDDVFFGIYSPKTKSFESYLFQNANKIMIKREDVSSFISLPRINFELKEKIND